MLPIETFFIRMNTNVATIQNRYRELLADIIQEQMQSYPKDEEDQAAVGRWLFSQPRIQLFLKYYCEFYVNVNIIDSQMYQ